MITDSFEPLGKGQAFSVHDCGKYNERFIFTVRSGSGENASIVSTNQSGNVQGALLIPDQFVRDLVDQLPSRFASDAPLRGVVNRFVPLLGLDGGSRDQILMVDLETLAFAWRAPHKTHFVETLMFKHGKDTLIVDVGAIGGPRDVWSVDGATGDVKQVIRVPSEGLAVSASLMPSHLGPTTVWLTSSSKTKLHTPPVAILRAGSLKPIHSSPVVRIEDVSDETRATIVHD